MYGNATDNNNIGLLFSLDELEKCDTRPKPKPKPKIKKMDLKYFNNPINDNEILFNLQKKYIETKSDAVYWELWQRTAIVAKRIIIKIIRAKGLIWADDEINDKVSETCLYLLRRYKTRPNYYVKINFIKAIKESAIHAVFYQNSFDKMTFYTNDLTPIENENQLRGGEDWDKNYLSIYEKKTLKN